MINKITLSYQRSTYNILIVRDVFLLILYIASAIG